MEPEKITFKVSGTFGALKSLGWHIGIILLECEVQLVEYQVHLADESNLHTILGVAWPHGDMSTEQKTSRFRQIVLEIPDISSIEIV